MPSPEQADLARLPLFDLRYMLRAYTDADSRKAMVAAAEATAIVLSDEKLAVADLRARFTADGEAFTVTMGDLTSEGFEFARTGYQRWLANLGRLKGEHSVAKLESALRKQVVKFRQASA